MKEIKYGFPEAAQVRIKEMKITYTQCPDTNSDRDEYQYLTIKTQNACADEPYYNLSIGDPETNNGHWSFDEPEELVAVIHDFIKRLGIPKNEEEGKIEPQTDLETKHK